MMGFRDRKTNLHWVLFAVGITVVVGLAVGGECLAADFISSETLYAVDVDCGSAGASCMGYSERRITTNTSYDKLAKINNMGDVAWQAKKTGENDYEIYIWKSTTDEIIQITENTYDDTDPRISDSGGVTWMGYDGNDWEVFLYVNGAIEQITDNTQQDKYPKINKNNEIVWLQGNENSKGKIEDFEMRYFNGTVVQSVTNNGGFNIQPRISDDSTLMWRGKPNESFDIFMNKAGVTTQISQDSLLEIHPQVARNGCMVWERNDGKDDEIMVKLGFEADPVQITDNTENDCMPKVNGRGEVTWQGYDGHDWEIFAYAGGNLSQLTDNEVEDVNPIINESGDISWLSKEPGGTGLWMYRRESQKMGRIGAVFTGHYRPEQDMNNSAQTVWSGSDGSDFEIYLATPTQ